MKRVRGTILGSFGRRIIIEIAPGFSRIFDLGDHSLTAVLHTESVKAHAHGATEWDGTDDETDAILDAAAKATDIQPQDSRGVPPLTLPDTDIVSRS